MTPTHVQQLHRQQQKSRHAPRVSHRGGCFVFLLPRTPKRMDSSFSDCDCDAFVSVSSTCNAFVDVRGIKLTHTHNSLHRTRCTESTRAAATKARHLKTKTNMSWTIDRYCDIKFILSVSLSFLCVYFIIVPTTLEFSSVIVIRSHASRHNQIPFSFLFVFADQPVFYSLVVIF